MTSHHDATTRWADRLAGRTTKAPLRSSSVFADGDTIYSFGQHFPMAKALRDKAGAVRLVVVNGDTFSNTTTEHQGGLRSALSKAELPHVIIPFTALRSAAVDLTTIELLGSLPDRIETTHHKVYAQPDTARWRVDDVMDYVPLTAEQTRAIIDEENAERMQRWQDRHGYAREEVARGKSGFWTRWLAESSVQEYPLEFTAAQIPEYQRQRYVKVGSVRRLYTSGTGGKVIEVDTLVDGRTVYTWTTTKHWLGESVIRARMNYTEHSRCRTCRGSGHGIGPVTEQVWENRQRYGRGSYEFLCEDCHGQGTKRAYKHRTPTFLSGFDHQEPQPLYFFCELPPRCKARTVAEAYEALKPETVRLAEQMGRDIVRQGDIFAVAMTTVTKRDLIKQGAKFAKRGVLLGTNHVATEVAYLPNGMTLARGTLTHAPGFRRPDHVRKTLGKAWHVTVKNTVPVSK